MAKGGDIVTEAIQKAVAESGDEGKELVDRFQAQHFGRTPEGARKRYEKLIKPKNDAKKLAKQQLKEGLIDDSECKRRCDNAEAAYQEACKAYTETDANLQAEANVSGKAAISHFSQGVDLEMSTFMQI